MMTIKDYAEDMNLTVEQVLALCDRVGIDYEDETTTLDDTQITLLDNIGFVWELESMWDEGYRHAREYFNTFHHLSMQKSY